MVTLRKSLLCLASLLAVSACSSANDSPSTANAGSGGTTAAGGDGQAGNAAGTGSGQAGAGGTTGQVGGSAGTGGTGEPNAGSGGASAAGSGGVGTAGSGGTNTGGAAGSGSSNPAYTPSPRPINVTGNNVFNENRLFLDHGKPALGKLVLFLGGIGGGPGGGGIESFVHKFGFHCFSPATDTNLTGGSVPDMYASDDPNDTEANRQVADARMELWDGMDRVDWYSHDGDMLSQTIAAIQQAEVDDPEGDWGYFLDDQGNLRTGDVWVVGYSWGSQTWAMISAYVPFGRVITTSGPQDEGFPYGAWITNPSPAGTPGDRKYLLVGLKNPYEDMDPGDDHELGMVDTVVNAGWTAGVTDVFPDSTGPYMDPERLFALIGGEGGTTPGGHTVFCNDNPANGWVPLCNYVFGVQ